MLTESRMKQIRDLFMSGKFEQGGWISAEEQEIEGEIFEVGKGTVELIFHPSKVSAEEISEVLKDADFYQFALHVLQNYSDDAIIPDTVRSSEEDKKVIVSGDYHYKRLFDP